MNAFGLNYENAFGVDGHAGGLEDFLGQPFFVFLFDFHKVGHKFGVVDEVFNLLQKVKIGDPVVADLGRNERCQRRVGVIQPAPRSDAVGYVDEFFRPQFVEFRHQAGFQQFRMDFGHPVDFKGTDDRKVGHADDLVVAVARYDGNFAQFVRPVAEFGFGKFDEAAVDFIDDLQMPRQHPSHHPGRPDFQCFRQQGMVGVGKNFGSDFPGGVPGLSVNVDQLMHHFGDGQRRVGIV